MNKIVGFILLPLYSSYFLIEEYGLLALFDTIFDFMNIFASLGIVQAFKRWYWDKDNPNRQKTIFTNTLVFSFMSAIFFGIILKFFLSSFDEAIFGRNLSNGFANIYILSIIANIVMHKVFILLQTKRLASVNLKYNVIRASVTCLLTVVFIKYFDLGIISVFLARLCGFCFTLILLAPRIIRNINWHIDLKILRDMLKFSYPLAISSSLSMILTLSDRWLLKGMSSLGDVGQYSLAYRITNIVKFLVISSFIQAYVYTFFQKMNNPEHYKFYKRIVTYFTLAVMSVGLILVAYSKEVVFILAKSADYQSAYKIIPFLVFALLFSGLRQILVLPFYKYKHTKYISFIAVTAGIINILANILLIPKFSSYGAASATALSHLFVVFAYYLKGRKFTEFSYEIPRLGLILLVGIIVSTALIYFNAIDSWMIIIWKSLILLCFPVILYISGFFKNSEIETVKTATIKFFKK